MATIAVLYWQNYKKTKNLTNSAIKMSNFHNSINNSQITVLDPRSKDTLDGTVLQSHEEGTEPGLEVSDHDLKTICSNS